MLRGKDQRKHSMKSITKQLVIGVFIVALVTIASLGIRQIRFSINRSNTSENPVLAEIQEATSTRPSNFDNQPKSQQSLDANTKPDYYRKDTYIVDAEPNPQHGNALASGKEVPSDGRSEAKSVKSDDAKSEGSKGLQKISLGDYENLYITGEGELWYVSNQPDGSTTKMQVQIDNITGQMTIVGGGSYAKSEGSQSLQRISMGNREDLYITPENELWYVSRQPDGSTAKMQLQTENVNGETTVVGSGEMNVYPANDGKVR